LIAGAFGCASWKVINENDVPPSRWHDAQRSYTILEISRFQEIGTPLGSCASTAPPVTHTNPTVEIRRFTTSYLDNLRTGHYNEMMRAARFPGVLIMLAAVMACGRADQKTDPSSTTTQKQAATAPKTADLAYVCPMDRDIRSSAPGKCSRCGMALVAGIPDQTEYHLDLTVTPKPIKPGERVRLTFEVFDPWKDHRVEKFSVVHEKLFHAFIISRDMQFFVHDHPTWENGAFHYDIAFPKPGMYRILGDFYPEGAAPQLITDTLFVSGGDTPAAQLSRDYSIKDAENLKVELSTNPPDPVAGVFTQMRLSVNPGDGLEKYLGAWGHMLAASDDLIDLTHTHPYIADGSAEMQFSLVFPRPRVYRVWVQFQRHGVVNTAHFDVPVKAAPPHTDG
jgi:hypothetical protein